MAASIKRHSEWGVYELIFATEDISNENKFTAGRINTADGKLKVSAWCLSYISCD